MLHHMSSDGLQIKVGRDLITPHLRRCLARLSDRKPILRAAGTQLVSITKRSFREPALRIAPWKPKRDGQASNLIQHGVLSKSIRITAITSDSVTVGSDRKYAAIHQLGGIIRPKTKKALVFRVGGKVFSAKKVTMPARPFFPFSKTGSPADFAVKKVGAIIEKAVDNALGT